MIKKTHSLQEVVDDIFAYSKQQNEKKITYQKYLFKNREAEHSVMRDWLKRDIWNLYNEALPLVIGIHPNCWYSVSNSKDLFFNPYKSYYNKIKTLIPSCAGYSLTVQNIDVKEQHWKVRPSDFIHWMEGKGMSINSALDTCFMELTDASTDDEDVFEYWALDSNDKDTKNNNKTQSSEDKDLCRNRAKELWSKKPNMTITAMANTDEIQKYCNGKLYKIRTVKDWIKDLAPNPKAGRPPEHQ